MSDTQDIATRSSRDPQGKARERDSAYRLIPPADVLEDREGITLNLDMPGVSKERLTVQTDKNTLTVEAEIHIAMPEGMEALYAEIQSTHYRRSFTLSGELDAEKTVANLNNGVLSVHIPLRAELKPRKIDVQVN